MDVTLIKTFKHPLSWMYLGCVLAAILTQIVDPRTLIDTQEYYASINYNFHFESLKIDPMAGDRWMYVSRRTPGYPTLLFFLGGSGTLIIQGIAAILSPYVCLRILNYFGSAISHTLFWLLWLTFPLQFFYTALPMPEIGVQLMLITWIWLLVSKQIIKSNCVLALLLLFKPIFIVLGLPLTVYLYLYNKNSDIINSGLTGFLKFKNAFNPGFRGKILSFGIPMFALFSMATSNKSRWGIFHISSVSTTNFYEYNRFLILQKVKGSQYTDSLYQAESRVLNTLSNLDPEKGKYLQKRSRETLLDYPLHYAYLHLKGIIQMAIDPGRYDAMVFLKWPTRKGFLGVNDGSQTGRRPYYEWAYMVFFAALGLIKLTMFLWVIIQKIIKKTPFSTLEMVILSSIFAYAFAVGAVGTARYFLPLYPLIIVFILLYFSKFKRYENFTPQR